MDVMSGEPLKQETCKAVRKRFYEAADSVYGPGFLSMAEYYFIKNKGSSPFAMLFSEPRIVYDEWARIFKGEKPVISLIEKVAGTGHYALLHKIQNNDGTGVWRFFRGLTRSYSIPA